LRRNSATGSVWGSSDITPASRPWIGYHERAAAALAALAGAGPAEVVAMNSLTVNLHLMMVSFFRPDAHRNRVLIEKSAFSSDRYAIVSQLEYHGLCAERHLIEVAPRAGERNLRTEDVIDCLEREARASRSCCCPACSISPDRRSISPRSSPPQEIRGASVGLDLAHAIGNMPLNLHDWNADFAVWCSYKYLNAGPGAVGGCFVHERHGQRRDLPRFAGWWGHTKSTRFEMGPDFVPIAGAEGWQISNPPVLSTAPLLASLEVFQRADIARLRAKSIALTGFLQRLIEYKLPETVEIVTPAASAERGSQLSLAIALPAPQAKRCHERLLAAGVIGDWREPDILRWAPVPLYNSYRDVFTAVDALARAVGS
jgi:kynureninase